MPKENCHVLAVGGIGMSAIARLLKQKGRFVSGSDKNKSDLTCRLSEEGIEILEAFPSSTNCLIYSSAISFDHPELIRAKKNNIKILHRSEALSELMQKSDAILIAGTHGKTTVTSLLTHALISAGLDPSFAVGGILNNYRTNARLGNGSFFVSEADESDGSFLKHPCKYAIVTNLDDDHLDYWKTEDRLKNAFKEFLTKPTKKLFWCYDDKNLRNLNPRGISYGFSGSADLKIKDYKTVKGGSTFSIEYLNYTYESIFIPFYGNHQVLNSAAIIAFFLECNLDVQHLFSSFKTFMGIKRRQEHIGSHCYVDVYNDYAHHPTEVCAILDSFRQKIEERRLVVVFQPHRFSRISMLIDKFKDCFSEADLLYVTEIHGVSEKPIEGCCESFFQNINHSKKQLISSEDLYNKLQSNIAMHDCVLFLGAGDINQISIDFFEVYKKTNKKLKVGILYGGSSFEHEISIRSAQFFFDNIDKNNYDVFPCFIDKSFDLDLNLLAKIQACDVCIPVLHGKKGEDGLIQAILEGLKIPFTGCNYYSSSVCMNKAWTKAICESVKILTSKYLHITLRDWKFERRKILDKIKNLLSTPSYIKGCHMGSTIGIAKCENILSLEKDIDYVFSFDDELIVEEEVIGRQIEFAIYGNDFIHVGEPAEIEWSGIYTYEKKYDNDLAKIPVNLDCKLLEKGQEIAIQAYKACSCRGLARIDFFLDEQNTFILNEINPIPGFTRTSPYYPMLKYKKITENEFINKLIILALHSHRSHV